MFFFPPCPSWPISSFARSTLEDLGECPEMDQFSLWQRRTPIRFADTLPLASHGQTTDNVANFSLSTP